MRSRKTRIQLFERLKHMIDSGIYPAGCRMPGERELCAELGVARETLRRALEMLEDENKIIRKVPGGTYVCDQDHFAEDHTLYFLIPCPDYFERSGNSTYLRLSSLLSGCLKESHLLNFSVVTLSLSQTNDKDDIDWNSIRRIPNGARVMVFGNWFENVFEYLHEKQCRVMLLHNIWWRPLTDYPEHDGYYNWANCFFDVKTMYQEHIRRLHCKGARKILIAYPYIFCPHSPIMAGVEEMKRKLPDCHIDFLETPKDDPDDGRLRRMISERYREHGFDGLIVLIPDSFHPDYRKTLNKNLDIPDSIPIYTDSKTPVNNNLPRPVPTAVFDFVSAGIMASSYLFSGTYSSKRFTFSHTYLNDGVEK